MRYLTLSLALICVCLFAVPVQAGHGFHGGRTFSHGAFFFVPTYSAPVVVATAPAPAPTPVLTGPVSAAYIAPAASVQLSAQTLAFLASQSYSQQLAFLTTFYGSQATVIHARHFTRTGRRR